MVGNDITSKVGWIKSKTTEHEIPTDHTSWLYSTTLGDPTLSDPTLRLEEDFDPEVAGILSDIQITPNLERNKNLITRFINLNPKKKESVLLHIGDSKAEVLSKSIPDYQLNTGCLLKILSFNHKFFRIYIYKNHIYISSYHINQFSITI